MDQHKVVIIEDDKVTQMLIERIMQREFKCDTITFKNGLEGLEYAKKHKSNLILLDIMLPGMNGYEILKELRSDELHKETKIIMMSAKSSSEDIERSFEMKADEYITKPFQKREFIVRVKKLLKAS
ncbi:response regulator [Rhodohalobacter sp. SW132]|uniref:response regulator transcription factor n=1 Tax=Rhodohalobacter sp. SW132 TaxID=2293433 RepID=UPI000E23BB02|nr:response regulator [Rhodohalobacter sp. SW132]REL37950.1 response regulator [Rhodohalobacter sp. SW132]